MDIETAKAKAQAIVNDNPHLDGIAHDTRQWLVNDIARALQDTARDAYEAGTANGLQSWRDTIAAHEQH